MNLTDNRRFKFIIILAIALPLIVSEIMMIGMSYRNKRDAEKIRYSQEARFIYNDLYSKQEYASKVVQSLKTSSYVNDYLTKEYESDFDYFSAYHNFITTTMFQDCIGIDNATLTIYADNETIINGNGFGRLSTVRGSDWYKQFVDGGRKNSLIFYYDESEVGSIYPRRKVAYVADLNFFKNDNMERIAKIEISYTNLLMELGEFNIQDDTFLVDESGLVLMSNVSRYSSLMARYKEFTSEDKVVYQEYITLAASPFSIKILRDTDGILANYMSTVVIGVMALIADIALAILLLRVIKIRMMQQQLLVQQMEISQKEAELLALRSQINPHFLFNALESIRMHCVIKHEEETAEMVEKLALMHRQNVDWNIDRISIEEECRFVDAYLSLQKYRFGDKLSYSIEIEDELRDVSIPKLTIVTFVENACVHGIEEKSSRGFVFIRVGGDRGDITIEVEDTGVGISNDLAQELSEIMNNATIEELQHSIKEGKGRSHVGMLNACVRLKMMFDNVVFKVEVERNVGTLVTISIFENKV